MVKYSRYQRFGRTYIIDPESPSSYSGYTKDKKSCDSVGLTVEGVVRLTREIRDIEAKR